MDRKQTLRIIEKIINEINTVDCDSLQSKDIILANVKIDLMSLKNKLDEGE